MPCKWKPEHREHLGDVALKASNSPGDAIGIMSAALDAFFADSSQAKYRYSPAGLAHGFDTYAAEALEQEAQALNDRKRAKRDAELEAIDAAILAADEAKKAKRKAERKAEREANGTSRAGAPGGNLGPDLEGWS